MHPHQIRALIRRWAAIVVVFAAVGALSAFAVTRTIKPQYASSGTIEVIAPAQQINSASLGLQATQIIATTAELMVQPPVLNQVAADLHLPSSVNLAKEVTATPSGDTSLITVVTTDADPNRAAQIANAVMTDYVNNVTKENSSQISRDTSALAALQMTLTAQIAHEQAQLAAPSGASSTLAQQLASDQNALAQVTSQYDTLIANEGQNQSTVKVISPGVVNGIPVSPDTKLNVGLGAFAGLLVGIGVAVLMQYLDQGLRSEDDVRRHLELPTLAVVPRYSAPGGSRKGDRLAGTAAEAYRRLRTSLLFTSVDEPISSVLVTSARDGEGKTRTAANLAAMVGASGQRVLLVDGDLRRPSQHRVFGQPPSNGLSDMLLRSSRSDPSLIGVNVGEQDGFVPTGFANLWLLSAGTIPPNPSELLASRQTQHLMRALQQRFDLMVIDSPPTEAVTDALSLAPSVDAVVLVIESGRTNAREARETVAALRGVGANVIGVVLNKARPRDLRTYYYYTDYSSDTGSDATEQANGTGPSGTGQHWQPIGDAVVSSR